MREFFNGVVVANTEKTLNRECVLRCSEHFFFRLGGESLKKMDERFDDDLSLIHI